MADSYLDLAKRHYERARELIHDFDTPRTHAELGQLAIALHTTELNERLLKAQEEALAAQNALVANARRISGTYEEAMVKMELVQPRAEVRDDPQAGRRPDDEVI